MPGEGRGSRGRLVGRYRRCPLGVRADHHRGLVLPAAVRPVAGGLAGDARIARGTADRASAQREMARVLGRVLVGAAGGALIAPRPVFIDLFGGAIRTTQGRWGCRSQMDSFELGTE